MTQIRHYKTGEILFELKGNSLKETISIAVKNKVNLSKADLSGTHLTGTNLSGANLEGANLEKVKLYGANLSHTNLIGANLSESNLSGTNFSEANLQGADLEGAILYEAYLQNTNLQGADLQRAKLERACLQKAKLQRANLSEVDFSGADLKEANLEGANLQQTNFTNTILRYTNFKTSKFYRTIMGLTDLSFALGLEEAIVSGECVIDFVTIKKSPNIPHSFLNKLGISELVLDYVHDLTNANPVKMFPVFLSHSWSNKLFARKLYESLIDNKIHCWFDERNTRPGDRLVSAISDGINDYDKMILVCSKESLTSWWVEREIERILKKERMYNNGKKETEKVNLLIPISIDDYVFNEWDSPWAEEINRYIIGDFRDWNNSDNYEKSLKNLIKGIRVEPKDFIPPSYLPPIK